MIPQRAPFRTALFFLLSILCFIGFILTLLVFSPKNPVVIVLISVFWWIFILFFLYKIYRLSHRRAIFQKGIYSLHDLDDIDGIDFEELTCDILVANGFETAENTQASMDFGVDVLACKDGITYAIQCKRYHGPVGIEAVQQIYAGRAYYECHVAVVLTNQYFTSNAHKLADKIGVALWDRDMLEQLL